MTPIRSIVRTTAAALALSVTGASLALTAVAPAASAAEPVDVRVGTYNIRNVSLDGRATGEARPWRERRAAVVANITGENVDVIGIQEANPSSTFKGQLVAGSNQYKDLRAGLNAAGGSFKLANAYAFNCKKPSTSFRCEPKQRGASQSDRILYNTRTLSLVSQGAMKYDEQARRDSPAYLSWAVLRVNANGALFLFTTTHLEPKNQSIRADQWSQMISKINAISGGLPVVATGDFNTHKHAALAARFLPAMYDNGYGDTLGQRYHEHELASPRARSRMNTWMNSYNHHNRDVRAWSQWTRPERPGNNIDWIFASNHLPVLEYKVVANYDPTTMQLNGVIPSDHNMIRATLAIG